MQLPFTCLVTYLVHTVTLVTLVTPGQAVHLSAKHTFNQEANVTNKKWQQNGSNKQASNCDQMPFFMPATTDMVLNRFIQLVQSVI